MVSTKKQEQVQKLTNEIKVAPVVGIVNFENLPAQQLQKMRAMLKKQGVTIRMMRKNLLKLALDSSSKEKIELLADKLKGMPAVILSTSNPFTLYKTIQKNKSEAPAKAGQAAPREIVVKAGPTNFSPGPIISELGAVGIKTKVENGKLAIISDVTVIEEGGVISAKLAETLKRLDIKPMEIGLDLVAVWENGTIFVAKQLYIDEEEYKNNITQAAQWAVNLAIECAYPTKETTELLVQKAFREAKAVGIEAAILNEVTKEEIVAKAERQAQVVKEQAKL